VVVCHHDGGHARFPSKLKRLFQCLHLQVTIDYVGLKRTPSLPNAVGCVIVHLGG
jgi:hypothetical protein